MLSGPWLAVLTLTLAGLAILAYTLRALDGPGSFASVVLGLAIALSTGIGWLLLLVCFSGLGVLATRVGYKRKKAQRVAEAHGGERGLGNVLGNGSAAMLVALLVPLGAPRTAAMVAFATAIAAVTADTLASELGVLAPHPRLVVPPFAPARPGDNGAVSLRGQFAALLGSGLIACAAVGLISLSWVGAAVVTLAGWFGCQVDSFLGATVERSATRGGLSKQHVNFLCGAVPATMVLAALWLWR